MHPQARPRTKTEFRVATQPPNLPPLDYATPAPQPPASFSPVPLVLAIAAGLFGVLMLFYGAAGIVWLTRTWRRTDAQDVFEVAMFNLIGAACALVAVRWIRSGIKRRGRQPADM